MLHSKSKQLEIFMNSNWYSAIRKLSINVYFKSLYFAKLVQS